MRCSQLKIVRYGCLQCLFVVFEIDRWMDGWIDTERGAVESGKEI